MGFEIWVYCLQQSVNQSSIWIVFRLIYSLKFKMTQNQNKGSKVTQDWPLSFSVQGLPKCCYNAINRLCPLKSIIINHTYLHCSLKTDLLHLYLISFCKISCSAPQGPHQRQSLAGSFDHWWFPYTCCLTGLNCYNVTSGSGTCNNVTSSSAKQVCRHGFTKMGSNVMKKWYFFIT